MADTDYQKDKDGREIALEARAAEEDRLFSPSAARNREAIREVFLQHMPPEGLIVEIGSGTGEHAVEILKAAPDLIWQPSDPDETSRRSVNGWARHEALANLRPALNLDVTQAGWWREIERPIAGIVSINMIHIAPFAAAEGLIAGAGAKLASGDKLFLYGPFRRNGHTAPSNEDFDQSLKSRHPSWGVRDLDLEIIPLADRHNLSLETMVEMPANNLSVMFTRR
ncbi:DUF938 domain-containing protein [Parvularcula flava]|uniref:DUF938 domain-containing protein n=1 Tax=Aquisalinus luteolus TaxID=1566827 RepID=A0A8J3A4I4_9PROT|nr:DUF938 domain-containing protein [Aquisalinus luteolus]NHK28549.1 DUF938 domain-containing protein [Aquisalinus luteolus]GGH98811.1 SAM-dependent methyltransferase [Aquisalinus luteolus]